MSITRASYLLWVLAVGCLSNRLVAQGGKCCDLDSVDSYTFTGSYPQDSNACTSASMTPYYATSFVTPVFVSLQCSLQASAQSCSPGTCSTPRPMPFSDYGLSTGLCVFWAPLPTPSPYVQQCPGTFCWNAIVRDWYIVFGLAPMPGAEHTFGKVDCTTCGPTG